MAFQAEGSKAKYVRDLLDKALELPAPKLSPEEFLREFEMHVTADEITHLTLADVMIRQLVMRAAKGNDKSIAEILDRLLGKAMQTTESVVKSYNYHDYLIECRNQDEAEEKKVVIDAVAHLALNPGVPAFPKLSPSPPLEDDLLKDFL